MNASRAARFGSNCARPGSGMLGDRPPIPPWGPADQVPDILPRLQPWLKATRGCDPSSYRFRPASPAPILAAASNRRSRPRLLLDLAALS
jgi:hypothetical protein